jgi:ABC-2 type transport system ATP-binding protein
MPIIETRQLSKNFRRYLKPEGLAASVRSLFRREYETKAAVRDFDLSVEDGEFIGLIGPNGAGKTTLVKMLSGIIPPSSGGISVMGFFPNKLEKAFKTQYAIVMGQKSQLFFELTPADTFRLFKEMYRIPEAEYRRSRDYLTELFGVKALLDVQVRTLSLGERMKMELIVALLHGPRLLFLDEPTIGLDAVASRQMRGFLREVNRERGTTIILTSHYMEDIKALCPRSVVINRGSKIFDGETNALFDRYQRFKRVTLSFAEPTGLSLPESCSMVEAEALKTSFNVPKAEAGELVGRLMRECAPSDIAVEEEEIGAVVERIYQAAGGEA